MADEGRKVLWEAPERVVSALSIESAQRQISYFVVERTLKPWIKHSNSVLCILKTF